MKTVEIEDKYNAMLEKIATIRRKTKQQVLEAMIEDEYKRTTQIGSRGLGFTNMLLVNKLKTLGEN